MRLIILLALIPFSQFVYATQSLPERIKMFSQELLAQEQQAVYDLRQLQSLYPAPLLLPSSLLPQSAQYPLQALKRLYDGAQSCKGPWPVSPLVTQPLVFTRAICNNTELPVSWFVRAGYIHPGGGSYAKRYIEKHPEIGETLIRFYHIQERPLAEADSALGRLQRMKGEAIKAIIAGAETVLTDGELWLRSGNYYYVFDELSWRSALEKHAIELTPLDNVEFCTTKSGNICWQLKDISQLTYYWFVGLMTGNVLLLIGWGIYRWRNRRRAMQERMLVLQILTHELRTPIASLGMTVEGFRRNFDALPESLYDEFRRLCEDARRLRQLAEASKDYLQANQQALSTEKLESLNSWLEYVCEPYDVTLSLDDNDHSVTVNVYWLGTCITNLLSNAQKYGTLPIVLQASVQRGKLVIRIKDQGQLSAKDWPKLRKPFVSEKGLGLGLTIVESMVARMGGKLKLEGPPTTFILEIPCESNTAIG